MKNVIAHLEQYLHTLTTNEPINRRDGGRHVVLADLEAQAAEETRQALNILRGHLPEQAGDTHRDVAEAQQTGDTPVGSAGAQHAVNAEPARPCIQLELNSRLLAQEQAAGVAHVVNMALAQAGRADLKASVRQLHIHSGSSATISFQVGE